MLESSMITIKNLCAASLSQRNLLQYRDRSTSILMNAIPKRLKGGWTENELQ
jgi:hypothetical protein